MHSNEVKLFVSLQMPPFKHGLDEHGLVSNWHAWPVLNWLHWHKYWFSSKSKTQMPWLEQLAKHDDKSPSYDSKMTFNWLPELFEVKNEEIFKKGSGVVVVVKEFVAGNAEVVTEIEEKSVEVESIVVEYGGVEYGVDKYVDIDSSVVKYVVDESWVGLESIVVESNEVEYDVEESCEIEYVTEDSSVKIESVKVESVKDDCNEIESEAKSDVVEPVVVKYVVDESWVGIESIEVESGEVESCEVVYDVEESDVVENSGVEYVWEDPE